MNKGVLMIVSGPSGCGKGTILAEILKNDNFYYSISATTRQPRPGEADGINYHFLSKEKFEELIDPLKLTVDKEIQTTMEINEMVDLACDTSDWATFNWLNGHDKVKGMLVDEQVEEESISRTALDIGMQDGSWLRKEKSIMNAYTGDLD